MTPVEASSEVWVVPVDAPGRAADAVRTGAGLVVVGSDATLVGEVVRSLPADAPRVAAWLDPFDLAGLREMLAELYPGATVVVQTTSPPLRDLL